jgi:hypothetical protein
MTFNVGDLVVLTRVTKIDEWLNDDDYTAEDYFYDRDQYIVDAVTSGGNVLQYSQPVWYREDEDGNEYELDEPESSEEYLRWEPENNPEWCFATLEMLQILKGNHANNTGLDGICKKVLQLYRKHNAFHGSAFQFKGV